MMILANINHHLIVLKECDKNIYAFLDFFSNTVTIHPLSIYEFKFSWKILSFLNGSQMFEIWLLGRNV